MRGRCNVVWVAVVAGGLDDPIPGTKTLAIGTWNVISLGGKEPERYWLEIVDSAACHVLEFTPVNERVASLRLRVGDRSLALPRLCLRAEQQYRVPGLLGVHGRGLHCSTGGLQRSRVQQQRYLEGRDWEERPPLI
ncbi:hypothetical protein L3Q82_021227 [Scortum barcoo]|uniref:Uncharacterized protein n=1 Tax=Scortum barcoo TaxID=214431 RepID=A0ACB8X3T2_9TELE|nr:hypothetical protein L3Q82_021227 [Scortum barcoo]